MLTRTRCVVLAIGMMVPAALIACTSDDEASPSPVTPDAATDSDPSKDSSPEDTSFDAGREGSTDADTLFVTITSPANNATIGLPADGRVEVAFDSNMFLRPAKTCADAGAVAHCGHAHLTIDGNACNAPRPLADGGLTKQTYNTAVERPSPAIADFYYCPMPTAGAHTIKVELRQDNHAPLNPVVSASITVNVTDPDGGFVRDGGM